MLLMVPAVAVKVAVVAAAATVTDAGTVRVELVLVRVTEAPPVGAAWVRVTVQVELPELFKAVGTQDKELTVGKTAPPVTVPPVVESGMPLPAGEEATLLLMPIAVVVTPTAMVKFTTATVPFEMMPAFIPEARHVYVPEVVEQLNVLLAEVTVAPELTEIETTLARGYVNVHCRADGSLPAGEVRIKLRATVPLEAAVPDERARESGPVCAKHGRAHHREAIAKIHATQPRGEDLIMFSTSTFI